jgi:hypothetical protein
VSIGTVVMTGVEALIAFAKAHPELVAELIDVVEGKKLTPEQVSAALRLAMVTASDLEMKRELGV